MCVWEGGYLIVVEGSLISEAVNTRVVCRSLRETPRCIGVECAATALSMFSLSSRLCMCVGVLVVSGA